MAPSGIPRRLLPSSRLASMTLRRTGLPVTTIWVSGATCDLKASMAAGSDTQTLRTFPAAFLLARPGTEFCSWMTQGTPWEWHQLMRGAST